MAIINTTETSIIYNGDKILWDLWLSRLHLPILGVADTINLFQQIENSDGNINTIASSLKINPRGVEALVYFLASLEILEVRSGLAKLTEASRNYLLPESKFYWRDALIRTLDTDEYKRILAAISYQSDQLQINGKDITQMWETGNVDPEAAKFFTKIMHATIHPAADAAVRSNAFSGTRHLLDVGGGSGCFATSFLEQYPESYATIFELPEVCQLLDSPKNDKLNTCAGNFFIDDFPQDHDGILFSNILHDWQVNKAQILLNKAFRALPSGSKIFIHEMLLNEDKCGPTTTTAFNLLMYINHGSQQYTRTELFGLLESAGFKNCTQTQTHPYYSLVIAQKP